MYINIYNYSEKCYFGYTVFNHKKKLTFVIRLADRTVGHMI